MPPEMTALTTRALLAAVPAVLLAACATTPATNSAALDIPAVTEAGDISRETMVEMTRTLSSDAFEGRAPGTPGEEKTVGYLIQQFQQAGLQPGNNGSWVQEVPLVEITGKNYAPLQDQPAPATANLSFDFADQWVGVTYREDARTALANSELVFVRLRHQRARARLERLRGRRYARQDGRDPRQRSPITRCKAWTAPFGGRGDDLLRPLDPTSSRKPRGRARPPR